MERISIGIEKRLSLSALEMAISSILDGTYTPTYFQELAHTECAGTNRARKVVASLNKMTVKSRLLPYMTAHKDEVSTMLRTANDRGLFYTSVMCSAYSIFYDTVATLGKFFHVQQEVNREYLLKKLSEKYGSNRSLDVAFDCVMPMLIEAGIVVRPKPGIYEMKPQTKYSDAALNIYKQAFLLNNPELVEAANMESNPFFEFIR